MPPSFYKIRTFICGLLLALVFAGAAIAQSPTSSPTQDPYHMSSNELDNAHWQQTVTRLYNIPETPPPFDPNRTADYLLANCGSWQQPEAPNAQSEAWYRAATTLEQTRMKTVEQHKQMLQLYEGAARMGHYRAIKDLTIIYGRNSLARGFARFKREPEKVRYWINVGLQNRWIGALEWLSTALHGGGGRLS
ncbi:MAG: hypothetical protein ACRCWR_03780 [Saezia sp.]